MHIKYVHMLIPNVDGFVD